MQMFFKDQDMEIWKIISNGPYVPMTTVDGKEIPKAEDKFTQTDLEKISKNFRAINLLYCVLDANKFNRISSCESAKQIWDTLVVTYEGIGKVKETKINIFVH